MGTALVGLLGLVALVALGARTSVGPEPTAASGSARQSPLEPRRHGRPGGPLGETDGSVPEGATVFDRRVPGVTHLDVGLLAALRRAATDAGRSGVTFTVTSGWRSAAYQRQLRRDAVARYGSEAEAARWVAAPKTSAHVSGDAVDLGRAAWTWLALHGASYGLCRTYRNEPWHYELRPAAERNGCPAMYADAAHDPRMRR